MTARVNPVASLFPLLILGLLAGLSYWLELASRAPVTAATGHTRHDPDTLVYGFEIRRFDAEGRLQHTLRAAEMRHYPDDDSTEVIAPRLVYHRNPPTEIEAARALVSGRGERVSLRDDVRVRRGATGDRPATELTTAALDVWPEDEIARSDAPVTITQGASRIQGAGGLEADHKNQRYVLAGPVSGVFVRPPRAAASPSPLVRVPQADRPARAQRKPTRRS